MSGKDTAFPVGATLADGGYRIHSRLIGERWLGRYLGQSADGSPVLVTTGGAQKTPVEQVAESLTLKSDAISPLLHVGRLSGNDPATHGFDGMVEALPAGQPLTEVMASLSARAGLDIARQVARSLIQAQQDGVILGELPAELIYVSQVDGAYQVSGLVPRAPRFWRTAKMPNFGLPQVFSYPLLSPEVTWGKPPVPSSDSYVIALCTVLLMTGTFPFAGNDYGSRLMMMQMGALGPLGVPEPLADLLGRALDTDPGKRPAPDKLRDGLAAAPTPG